MRAKHERRRDEYEHGGRLPRDVGADLIQEGRECTRDERTGPIRATRPVLSTDRVFGRDNRHQISTGPLEGFNNKAQTMKRQAYGYRNMRFFMLKLRTLHVKKYALTG